MKTETNARLVVIYLNSTDQHHGRPLYAAVVQRCEELGIAGATVLRCDEGYGAHHRLHTARLLGLAQDMPVRIEIVDTAEHTDTLLAALEGMIGEGLVTVQEVRAVRFSADPKA